MIMKEFTEATPEQVKVARKILRRRNIGLLLMILYLPLFLILPKITGSDIISGIVAFIFLLTVAGFLFSVALAKCPRCEKLFFTKWYWANGFALKCVHCGLR